jgi:hypothetical protein
MEDEAKQSIEAFDTITTNNHIQMLKILLPRISPAGQAAFAVYIKLLELVHTIRHFNGLKIAPAQGAGASPLTFSLEDRALSETVQLLDELLCLADAGERERIEGMKRSLNSLLKMKEMSRMLKTLQELFPEGSDENPGEDPSELFSLLSRLGGMDLSELAGMFGAGPEV